MSAVGVDLGSHRSVIAAVIHRGIEIIANESSYRATANLVGYGDQERLLGDLANAKINRNFKNTCAYFTRILNLEHGSADFKKEKKHLFTKLVKNQDGKVSYEVQYNKEKIEITPEQALTAYFTKVLEVMRLNDIKHSELAVTVPSYFTIGEKRGVQAAAAVAGVTLTALVDESICNLANYCLFRRSALSEEYKSVAFVDFGHSKTSVYIAEVSKKDAKIIYEQSDRHMGTRDLTYALYEHFNRQFEEQSGNTCEENPKSKLKLLSAIDKTREILSGNSDANIHVEYLIEEDDFSSSITREDFENLTKDVFNNFRELLKQAIKASGVNPKNIETVEILGGGTRTPMVQQIICEEFGVATVSKTLDQTESCARGAAIKAAERSATVNVVKYPIKFLNPSNIRCKYLIAKKSDGTIKESDNILFKKSCEFPCSMSISVPSTDSSKLELYYETPSSSREPCPIFNFSTAQVTPTHEDYKLVLRAKVDDSLIPYMKSCELEEHYVEEVEVEKKKTTQEKKKEEPKEGETNNSPMEEEEKKEFKKVKKTRVTQVKLIDNTAKIYPVEMLEGFKKLEDAMRSRDSTIKNTNRVRNDLEALLYAAKSACDSEWDAYLTPSDKNAILQLASTLEAWIYQDGTRATIEDFTTRLHELTGLTKPVSERKSEHEKVHIAMDYVAEKIAKYRSEIPQNVSLLKKFTNLVSWKVLIHSFSFDFFLQHI